MKEKKKKENKCERSVFPIRSEHRSTSTFKMYSIQLVQGNVDVIGIEIISSGTIFVLHMQSIQ